jgi:hypothetical protein
MVFALFRGGHAITQPPFPERGDDGSGGRHASPAAVFGMPATRPSSIRAKTHDWRCALHLDQRIERHALSCASTTGPEAVNRSIP